MTDDTSRRERALATVDEIPPDADMDWADAQETRSDYGLGFLVGYLAGAREEAAIKDAEIAALHHRIGELEKQNDADRQDFSAEIAGKDAQIKALGTIISGAIQRSWTPDDFNKFWIAAGEENP